MRSFLFSILLLTFSISVLNAQQSNQKKGSTTTQKKSEKLNSNNLPTKNTNNVAPKKGFEGITTFYDSTSTYSLDILIKKYAGNVDQQYLGGIWFYLKTNKLGKDKKLNTIVRAYYNDLDQELYNPKEQNTQSKVLSNDEMMYDATNMNRIEAEKLGRTTLEPTESLIVFDPNVQYLVFDKPGNNEDVLSIRKQKPNKEIIVLTTADIRISILEDIKNKKYYYILKDFGTGLEKEFLLLELSENNLVLCDEHYNEIHFFDRNGIHTK